MFYFEDIEVGTSAEFGSHTFTIEEMLWFAERYDRQAIHLDRDEAKKSLFGDIIASGWLTMAVFMKLFVAYVDDAGDRLRAAGKPVVPIGMPPGTSSASAARKKVVTCRPSTRPSTDSDAAATTTSSRMSSEGTSRCPVPLNARRVLSQEILAANE